MIDTAGLTDEELGSGAGARIELKTDCKKPVELDSADGCTENRVVGGRLSTDTSVDVGALVIA